MEQKPKLQKNISVINAYRAIGILIVVFSHYTVNITGFFDSPLLPYIHQVGKMAIIVFFTISGFVIPWWLQHAQYQIKDYGRFVARRMIRIEPPFIIALGLAIAYTYVRMMSPYYNGLETIPTGRQILLQLGYLVPFFEGEQWVRGSYWTLAVECQWYLVMGLTFPLFFNKRLWIRVTMYILVFVGVKVIGQYLFQYFPSLLIGTLLCSYMTDTIGKKEYILATAGVFLFFFIDKADPMIICGSGVIIPLLLYFSDFKNKYLTFLGNMSYSIYLMHSITGVALINYLSHIVTQPFMKIMVVFAGVLFTLICSYVFYLLVERPSHKLSLKITINEHEQKSNPKTKGNV
jgi:peptidoglycan/LPS O-acetylase OafA/YrhL